MKLNNEILLLWSNITVFEVWAKVVHPAQPAALTTSSQACMLVKFNLFNQLYAKFDMYVLCSFINMRDVSHN